MGFLFANALLIIRAYKDVAQGEFALAVMPAPVAVGLVQRCVAGNLGFGKWLKSAY
jgi:hypothetical protein